VAGGHADRTPEECIQDCSKWVSETGPVATLPELGSRRMVEILPGDVREWVTRMKDVLGARPPTIRKGKVVLDAIFTTALSDQITAFDQRNTPFPPGPRPSRSSCRGILSWRCCHGGDQCCSSSGLALGIWFHVGKYLFVHSRGRAHPAPIWTPA
jgi:hypothetical protein